MQSQAAHMISSKIKSMTTQETVTSAADVQRKDPGVDFLLLAVFVFWAALVAFGLANHEMWGDELRAWVIARDSVSIPHLVQNCRLEGHPLLWHLALFSVTRFTHSPIGMQILNWAIACSSCFLIFRYAPFNRIQKFLLILGYFPLFEYGLISRPYGFMTLLSFAFAALMSRHAGRVLQIFILLGLLANTSIYGAIISSAFALAIGISWFDSRRNASRSNENVSRTDRRSRFIALSIFILLLSASVLQAGTGRFSDTPTSIPFPAMQKPAFLAYHRTPGYFMQRAGLVLMPLDSAYFPVPNSDKELWNSSIFRGKFYNPIASGAVALVLLVVLTAGMCNAPIAATGYALGTAAMLSYGFPALRHEGALFVLLVTALWLSRATAVQQNTSASPWVARCRTASQILFTVILTVQAVVGMYFYWCDVSKPFSSTRYIAERLKEEGLADMPIICNPDWRGTALSAWLDREVIFCERLSQGTFVPWDNKTPHATRDIEVYDRIANIMRYKKVSRCIFVKGSTKPFSDTRFASRCLFDDQTSLFPFERSAVYLVELKPPATTEIVRQAKPD